MTGRGRGATRGWLVPVLSAGVVCHVVAAVLFLRLDAAADLGFELDRDAAFEQASAIAAELGVDTTGWRSRAFVRRSSRHDLEVQQSLVRRGTELPVLPAATLRVVLTDPAGGGDVTVDLDPRGRLVTVENELEGHEVPEDPAAARDRAERLIVTHVGIDPGRLQRIDDAGGAPAEEFLSWRWSAAETPEVTLEVLATVRGSSVRTLSVRPRWSEVSSSSVHAPDVDQTRALKIGTVFVVFLLCCAALLPLVLAIVRRAAPLKSMLVLAAAVLVVLVPTMLLDQEATAVKERVGFAIAIVFMAVGRAVAWGGGFMAARRIYPERILAFELLLTGRAWSRVAGLELVVGVVVGGAMAAVPYVVGLVVAGPGTVVSFLDPDLFGVVCPVLEALSWVAYLCMGTLLVFALIMPVLEDRLASSVGARTVAWICGIALLGRAAPTDNLVVMLGSGILWVVIAEIVFRRLGLLAVTVAWVCSATTIGAVALLAQPASGLRQAGVLLAVGTLGLVVLGSAAAVRGRELGVEALPPVVGRTRAEREQIMAELEVAREAQRRMLPAAPPEVPGYDIAAVCRPARDVGGDLYDFGAPGVGHQGITIGSAGFAVGDVSGKGMAAALYMTLARGLLAAAAEESGDPVEILCEVNRDYHEMVPKNVFVTMLLATLDPESRRLRFARAGHTPLLWRRARRGVTELLEPRGLAVGLVGPTLFDRVLEVREIQLEPGDGLFLASDGISEAMNVQRQEYGDERFRWIVEQTDGLSASEARDTVLQDLATFCGKAPAHDDVTLVVVRVLE